MTSDPRPRLAIVHPWLQPLGGSEPVALWTAQALASDFRVQVWTMGAAGLAELDAAYGTSLETSGVEVVRLPVPRLLSRRGDALRSARLVRRIRSRARDFEVLLSAYNVLDFGRPGLQYVSDFSFSDPLRRALLADARDWKKAWKASGLLRHAYLALGRLLSAQSAAGWRANVTLANSEWTRRILFEAFGIEASTVYPPVLSAGPPPRWEDRADGFVALGRIVPEKGILEMMALVDRVRGPSGLIHFHVVGPPAETEYARTVTARARSLGDWISLDGPLFGRPKFELLARHRYGLSGCRHEAFGIAVAEMVRAGMIVWVPGGGGQAEIVDHPDLVYDSEEDAARKIDRVLRSPERQAVLRAHLARRAERFSAARFMDEMRAAVASFREGHGHTRP